MSATSGGFAAIDHEWLVREQNWLDARLAAAFLHAAEGRIEAASTELTIYRLECEDHLAEARRRMFLSLAHFDDRTLAAEQREWAVHAQDVRQAARAVHVTLDTDRETPLVAFEALRRAVRRQWTSERRLVQIAERRVGVQETPSPPSMNLAG